MKILLFIFVTIFAQIAQADCPKFYPLGKQISVPNSVELCNSFYAVKYDTVLNEPIISVEKFRVGNHPERSNDFHPDLRIDIANRAEKYDYSHSGYDQGHMTPAADATNDEEMHDTFLLSNMTPQEPTLNRQSWRVLEIEVRKENPDYVITGAIYSSHDSIGTHHVPIPSGYYKLTWKNCIISAWYADNKPHAQVVISTIEEVEKLSNLKFPRCEIN